MSYDRPDHMISDWWDWKQTGGTIVRIYWDKSFASHPWGSRNTFMSPRMFEGGGKFVPVPMSVEATSETHAQPDPRVCEYWDWFQPCGRLVRMFPQADPAWPWLGVRTAYHQNAIDMGGKFVPVFLTPENQF